MISRPYYLWVGYPVLVTCSPASLLRNFKRDFASHAYFSINKDVSEKLFSEKCAVLPEILHDSLSLCLPSAVHIW
jgi:hypothetical protein